MVAVPIIGFICSTILVLGHINDGNSSALIAWATLGIVNLINIAYLFLLYK